jgi:hypothetical protein
VHKKATMTTRFQSAFWLRQALLCSARTTFGAARVRRAGWIEGGKEGSSSFLKKRTKKLSLVLVRTNRFGCAY